jgi:hypothetical protein
MPLSSSASSSLAFTGRTDVASCDTATRAGASANGRADRPIEEIHSLWIASVKNGEAPARGPLPKPAASGAFLEPLNRLRAAERSYATGAGAAVFLHSRAAVEALPGYPNRSLRRWSILTKRRSWTLC